MYQCYAYNDIDGAQATAQIKIGGNIITTSFLIFTAFGLLPLHISQNI